MRPGVLYLHLRYDVGIEDRDILCTEAITVKVASDQMDALVEEHRENFFKALRAFVKVTDHISGTCEYAVAAAINSFLKRNTIA